MNNIQEDDWAEDSWAWHTGMKSDFSYRDKDDKKNEDSKNKSDDSEDIDKVQ